MRHFVDLTRKARNLLVVEFPNELRGSIRLFAVDSRTRKGLLHYVKLNRTLTSVELRCTCRYGSFGQVICSHTIAAMILYCQTRGETCQFFEEGTIVEEISGSILYVEGSPVGNAIFVCISPLAEGKLEQLQLFDVHDRAA